MVRAILTDLGNVVIFFDCQKVSKKLLGILTSQTLESIDNILNGSEGIKLLREFELGKISDEEYVVDLEKRLGCKLPRGEFWQCHTALFEPNHDVIKLYKAVKRIRPDMKLVAVTNTDHHRLSVMLNLSSLSFDATVASCFEGIAKPDVRIFMTAISAAEVAPAECLFVDDVEEYCDVAFNLGILAHHYRGIVQLRQELINRELALEDTL